MLKTGETVDGNWEEALDGGLVPPGSIGTETARLRERRLPPPGLPVNGHYWLPPPGAATRCVRTWVSKRARSAWDAKGW